MKMNIKSIIRFQSFLLWEKSRRVFTLVNTCLSLSTSMNLRLWKIKSMLRRLWLTSIIEWLVWTESRTFINLLKPPDMTLRNHYNWTRKDPIMNQFNPMKIIWIAQIQVLRCIFRKQVWLLGSWKKSKVSINLHKPPFKEQKTVEDFFLTEYQCRIIRSIKAQRKSTNP